MTSRHYALIGAVVVSLILVDNQGWISVLAMGVGAVLAFAYILGGARR